MTRAQKLVLLSGLYVSQGLPFGFFTQALPVWLRERGASLAVVGSASLLALPWALKFVLAPYVDRHRGGPLGARRSFIVPLQIAQVALLVALAFVDPGAAPGLLAAAVFATNLFSASQDVATDALAVDLLAEKDRGLGNGLQVGAYRAGMIVGGGALLAAFGLLGWRGTLLAMAGLVALVSVPVRVTAEPARATTAAVKGESVAGALARLTKRPFWSTWLVTLVAWKAGDAMASSMIKPLLVDRGVSLPSIGLIVGTVGFGAGLVGSLAGGALADHLGRRRAMLWTGALQAIAIVTWVLPAVRPLSTSELVVLSGVEHLAGGAATAVLFTRMMDLCEPDSAATDYTVQASVVVVATGACSAIAGVSAGTLGYAAHFACASVVSMVGVLAAMLTVKSPTPTANEVSP